MATPPMLTCGCRALATTEVDGREVFACPIHDCTTTAPEPDLAGRQAKCSCGKIASSDASDVEWYYLPFFEYRGEGSADANRACKHCAYHEAAHGDKPCWRCGGTGTYHAGQPCYVCKGAGVKTGIRDHAFEAHGPFEFDSWYCGHSGWG